MRFPRTMRDLGEHRVIGERRDGYNVVTTVAIIDNTNTFEVRECPTCHQTHVRVHDAEAWRKERTK